MSRIYNIRWSESDSRELSRAVRNYNAKVRRLEKKFEGQSDVVIPERITMKEMREVIGTRRDLNREIKSLQRFTERGSEELVEAKTDDTIYLTKWQSDELVRRAKRINQERARRREELESKELINQGEGLGYTRGAVGMGKAEALQLRPTKPFTPKMSKGDINRKFEHFRRESQSDYWKKRDILMRDNYIRALQNNFNPKDVKGIIEKIQNMSLDEFKDTVMSDPQEFDTLYLPSDEEYDGTLEYLNEMWGVNPNAKPKPKKKKRKKSKKRAGKK